MKNGPKRNHHTVPKLYLKGFAIKSEPGFIWVYKKGERYNPGLGRLTNNPYRETLRFAGMERDFYANPKSDGGLDFETVENTLERLEKPADRIFEKLHSRRALDAKEKEGFAVYLIQMHRRVHSSRLQAFDWATKTAQEYEPSRRTIAALEAQGLTDNLELRRRLKAQACEMAQRERHGIQAHNHVAMASPQSFLIEVLKRMIWTFYLAPTGHRFATSDNPVYIPCEVGLALSISELSFPISSELALVASWNKALREGFTDARTQIVKEINRRTIMTATTNVFFCESQEWVLKAASAGNYKFRPLFTQRQVYKVAELKQGPEGERSVVWLRKP